MGKRRTRSNTWLERVDYQDFHGPARTSGSGQTGGATASTAGSSAAAPTSTPSPTSPLSAPAAAQFASSFSPSFSWWLWLSQVSIQTIGSIVAVGLLAVFGYVWTPQPGGVVFLPVPIEQRNLVAAALERVDSKQNAAALAAREPIGNQLFYDWYDKGGHVEIGRRTGPQSYYVAVPRKGGNWGPLYQRLAHEGLKGIRQFEIHVPSTWTEEQLDIHKSHWATKCHVSREAIDLWSAFQVNGRWPPVSQCHPGGTCLVLAEDCENAFMDMQSQ